VLQRLRVSFRLRWSQFKLKQKQCKWSLWDQEDCPGTGRFSFLGQKQISGKNVGSVHWSKSQVSDTGYRFWQPEEGKCQTTMPVDSHSLPESPQHSQLQHPYSASKLSSPCSPFPKSSMNLSP